jgi:restriction system protein
VVKMTRIDDREPDTWENLEKAVLGVLREAGFEAQRNESIKTARGKVAVDVLATDRTTSPPSVILFECKHWRSRVPQTVVHAFRSVVSDSGANAGLIVSKSGFQAGAEVAASFSNVRLVGWSEFEQLYVERWFRRYMQPAGAAAIDPLLEYLEPINTRISRRANALAPTKFAQLQALRQTHSSLWPLVFIFHHIDWLGIEAAPPTLPLAESLDKAAMKAVGALPADVLNATSLRGLLGAATRAAQSAIADFDEVFGERA